MGYFKTKLCMHFKDYNSLESNGVSKVTKTYYLNNKDSVEESVKKSKISILKIVFTIIFIIALFLIYLCVIPEAFCKIFRLDVNLDPIYHLRTIAFDAHPYVFLAYALSYFDRSIRKSNCLRILFLFYLIYMLGILMAIIMAYIADFGNFH